VPQAGDGPQAQPLRPRARLMLTLGLELISSEAVAISELVKNSYDADATTVLISLREGENGESTSLLILDDGVGMSPDAITRNWFEPATPNRRRRKVSPSGRRSLGEKGIGRFAAAKLSHELQMVSHAQDSSADEAEVHADWDVFADENAYLDQISIPWLTRPAKVFTPLGEAAQLWNTALRRHDHPDVPEGAPPNPNHGTALWMINLRERWDEQLAAEVSRTLQRLISPAADEALENSQRDFRILLDLPPHLGIFGGWITPPEELGRPHYRLNALVDGGGHALIEMRLRGEGESREPLEIDLFGEDGQTPSCGPFSLNLRVWDRDREALAEISGSTSYQEMRKTLDHAAGVSIYREGFRVLPYGETGDDWLELDRRRINNPSKRLSNNQIIGAVNISRDDNPGLVDQSNREGIVEGPALADLRRLIREIILLLEVPRDELRHQDTLKSSRAATDIFEPTRLADLRSIAAERGDSALTAVIDDTEQLIEERSSAVREVVSRYQRLATLGQLVDQMVHEVAQPTTSARQAAVAGLELIEDNPQDVSGVLLRCGELVGQLRAEFLVVRDQTRVVSDVLRRLSPFGGRRRGRPRTILVEDAMRDVRQILRSEIDQKKVSVSLPDSRTPVTVDGTELQEILLNLATNSLYWVTKAKRNEQRRLILGLERAADGALELLVSDNGPGVPEGHRDRIFEPYFSTREGGIGLGLSIAGQIVEDYYGGKLELIRPGFIGGATFRATLRKRVGA
jgi:signal transduction histidine kinase